MRARFSFATGAWAAATAAASLISWAGVQIVTSAVTPSPVAVVPSSQIRPVSRPVANGPTFTSALSTVPATAGGVAAPSTLAATPAVSPVEHSSAPAPAQPAAPTPTAVPPSIMQPTIGPEGHGPVTAAPAPSSPSSTATVTASPSPTTSTTAPPTTNAGSVQEYTTPGGNAEFGCTGSVISLLSATPANGYQLHVISDGPQQAQVNFVSSQYQDSIIATCVNGQPSGQTSDRSNYGGWGGSLNDSPSASGTTTSTAPAGG